VKRFAANLELPKSKYGSSFPKSKSGSSFPKRKKSRARLKDYVIDIQLPEDSRILPEDLTVPPGTALAGCWGSRWRPLTVLSENDDGSIHVHWDEYSDSFDCNMKREQLVIENSTSHKIKKSNEDLD